MRPHEDATHDDSARVLDIVGDVIGLLESDEFRSGLIRALSAVVPADWISINDIGPTPQSTVVLIEPEFPVEAHETYARYAHENPLLVRYQQTGDGRAYRFSDVTTQEHLHATALYREFYARIGLEHQIAFTLPAEPDRVMAVALSRRERDFADGERELLNSARPFLIQAYNNALEHTRMQAELSRRVRKAEVPMSDPQLSAQLAERGITPRETQVLSLIVAGQSDSAAAEQLGIGQRTVHKHLQRCYRKLGVHSRAEVTSLAWALVGDRRQLDSSEP